MSPTCNICWQNYNKLEWHTPLDRSIIIKSHKTNCLDIKKHRRQSRLLCTKHDILKCLIWHIPLSYTMIHQREDFSPLLTDTSLLSSMYIYVTVEIERQLSFSSLLKSILWNLQQKKKKQRYFIFAKFVWKSKPFSCSPPFFSSVRWLDANPTWKNVTVWWCSWGTKSLTFSHDCLITPSCVSVWS